VKLRTGHALTILAGALFAFAIASSQDWPLGTRLFAQSIAVPGLILSVLNFTQEMLRFASGEPLSASFDVPMEKTIPAPVLRYRTLNVFGWILGLFLMIWLINFKFSIPLFTFLYLKFEARERFLSSFLLAGLMIALIIGIFDFVVHVPWPKGLVERWLGF